MAYEISSCFRVCTRFYNLWPRLCFCFLEKCWFAPFLTKRLFYFTKLFQGTWCNSAFKLSFSIPQTQRKDDLILQPHLKQIGKEWEESNTTRNTEQFVMRKGRIESSPGLGKSFDVFWRLGPPFESSFHPDNFFLFSRRSTLDAKPGFRFWNCGLEQLSWENTF